MWKRMGYSVPRPLPTLFFSFFFSFFFLDLSSRKPSVDRVCRYVSAMELACLPVCLLGLPGLCCTCVPFQPYLRR